MDIVSFDNLRNTNGIWLAEVGFSVQDALFWLRRQSVTTPGWWPHVLPLSTLCLALQPSLAGQSIDNFYFVDQGACCACLVLAGWFISTAYCRRVILIITPSCGTRIGKHAR